MYGKMYRCWIIYFFTRFFEPKKKLPLSPPYTYKYIFIGNVINFFNICNLTHFSRQIL